MNTYTEHELVEKITHLKCSLCNTSVSVADLGVRIGSISDIDDTTMYDVWDAITSCCGDPCLDAQIIQPTPLFDHEVDGEYMIRKVPRSTIADVVYEYTLDDDFFDAAREFDLVHDDD